MPLVGNHFLGEAQIERLRPRVSFRLCSLWQITRKDGVSIRLATTDKDVFFEGHWFLASGPSASDLEQGEAAAESDFELSGILDHENILETDLYAGKYDKAMIDHWVVDLERPWVWFRHHKWWIKQTSVFAGMFKAEVVGVEKFLTLPIGRKYEKDCDKVLASTECGATAPSFTGTIASVPTTEGSGMIANSTLDTAAFTITEPGSGWPLTVTSESPIWSFGSVLFNGGSMPGHLAQIGYSYFSGTTMYIVLSYKTPFAMRVGESVTISGGCDGTKATCEAIFANLINFGGQPDMPNTSSLYESPEQADAASFNTP